jgi:hypothetical protein
LRISWRVADALFKLCSFVFIGLSAYGVIMNMEEGAIAAVPLRDTLAYGVAMAVSIAGIFYFGRERDRRRAEETARPPEPAPPPARRRNR